MACFGSGGWGSGADRLSQDERRLASWRAHLSEDLGSGPTDLGVVADVATRMWLGWGSSPHVLAFWRRSAGYAARSCDTCEKRVFNHASR